MGRKKKKPSQKSKDARGYSRGGPGTAPPLAPRVRAPQQGQQQTNKSNGGAAPSVSARAHDEMRGLLDRLDSRADGTALSEGAAGGAFTSSSNAPSDRFASRLANVVDSLDDLGFTPEQVERAVKSSGYGITLEGALDWLCLNLTTLELPALFTDGDLRQDLATVTTAESLTVLRDAAPAPEEVESQLQNILAVANQVPENGQSNGYDKGETVNERDEADAQAEEEQKQRLLQQYAYEDEGDDDDKLPEIAETKAARDDQVELPMTPDERQLVEEERALAELEADANDDANNYMRSKAEIKELKIRAKRMKQQVKGLRRKVEREKSRLREVEKDKRLAQGADDNGDGAAGAQEDGGEENGGILFDVFGNDEDKDDTPATVEEEAPVETAKILDYTIPKGWTGATPQKKLEEVLKKRKLPRAKYNKLPANGGLRLTVSVDRNAPQETWEARSVDFCIDSSLRDYLATHALYALDPNVPLYQMFPPPFRALWLSWSIGEKEERDEARRQIDDDRQRRMDHLVSLISEGFRIDGSDAAPAKNASRNGQGDRAEDQHDEETSIIDDWEDDESDDASDGPYARTRVVRSNEGEKMRTKFAQRQSTPSYQKMKAARESLPMAAYRSDILEAVAKNPVTILCAETGAGKSTQCAQYLLEEALLSGHGDEANVICTQPRRVAATSLAERVADEMCDRLGETVGYQIRMESKRSARTRLLFCTTGIVLRRLQDDPSLSGITHVIVDEVHERQQQIDVILIVLRRLLQTTRPDLKVVLMSATMETELFRSFFQGAPLISVPGRTFPVSCYHLEDLLDATGHVVEEGSRYAFREDHHGGTASLWVTTRGGEKRKEIVDLTSQVGPRDVSDAYSGYKMSTRRSMERVNEEVINYDLIEDVLKLVTSEMSGDHTLVAPDGADMSRGSILIFLPGLGEIKSLIERLGGSRLFRDRQRFDLIPLHSTLSSQDQRRAFLPSKPGCRKIIAATNIAETSVTLPDVVCVIDSGRVREVRRNKRTSTSMLVTDWCPQSSARQRQGRAGRVQPGICLKLYSSATAESVMKTTNEPELRRVSLEEICMSILASGFAKSCSSFLEQAPQPPSKESVQSAMDILYDVGAVEKHASQVDGHELESLTPLGKHLAKLPVDVKLGKMLIFGSLFRCIDPIATIAASLSSKSPFSTFVDDAAAAKAKQKVFADPDSDFMTKVNVWDAYREAVETSSSAGRRFCHENYLNQVALREIGDARRQFLDLLCGIGFLTRDSISDTKSLKSSSRFNRHAKRAEVVHAVICAGLYPNVACLEQSSPKSYSMRHKDEIIFFHSASVNGAKKHFSDAEKWVLFHDKFATPNRTSVSTTAFVHPFVVALFGGSVSVKHTERRVVVDDWMSIGMPAQTGVILRELRHRVDVLLQRMIECADSNQMEQLDSSMIDGIIKILLS